MKKLLAILFTAFISTGAILAGLNQHRILLGYGIAAAAWLILGRSLSSRK